MESGTGSPDIGVPHGGLLLIEEFQQWDGMFASYPPVLADLAGRRRGMLLKEVGQTALQAFQGRMVKGKVSANAVQTTFDDCRFDQWIQVSQRTSMPGRKFFQHGRCAARCDAFTQQRIQQSSLSIGKLRRGTLADLVPASQQNFLADQVFEDRIQNSRTGIATHQRQDDGGRQLTSGPAALKFLLAAIEHPLLQFLKSLCRDVPPLWPSNADNALLINQASTDHLTLL